MRTRGLPVAGLSVAAVLIGGCPASAAGRAWVSGHGIDQAGCGAPANPCRSLQYAHDHAVGAGGEIDVLDPAGYGAITINKSVSIVNDGVGTAGVQATSAAAITINAGPSDTIYLRGLNIDGEQQAAEDGIRFNSGGSLAVANCVIRHFSQSGIRLALTSGTAIFLILNTTADENYSGFSLLPAGDGAANVFGTLDHVVLTRNNEDGAAISPGTAGVANFAIVDSVLSHNGHMGLIVEGDSATEVNTVVNVDGTHIDMNSVYGLWATGRADVHLSRSVLDQNGSVGIENDILAPGTLYSTGDNRVEGNGTGAVAGALPSNDPLY